MMRKSVSLLKMEIHKKNVKIQDKWESRIRDKTFLSNKLSQTHYWVVHKAKMGKESQIIMIWRKMGATV